MIYGMGSDKVLLSLYECAARLQVPVRWLKDAAIQGQIPCLLVGKRKLRFHLPSVKKAVRELAARGNNNVQ